MNNAIVRQYKVVANDDQEARCFWSFYPKPFVLLRFRTAYPTWFGLGKLREVWDGVRGLDVPSEAENAIKEDLRELAEEAATKLRQVRHSETHYEGRIRYDADAIGAPAVDWTARYTLEGNH